MFMRVCLCVCGDQLCNTDRLQGDAEGERSSQYGVVNPRSVPLSLCVCVYLYLLVCFLAALCLTQVRLIHPSSLLWFLPCSQLMLMLPLLPQFSFIPPLIICCSSLSFIRHSVGTLFTYLSFFLSLLPSVLDCMWTE